MTTVSTFRRTRRARTALHEQPRSSKTQGEHVRDGMQFMSESLGQIAAAITSPPEPPAGRLEAVVDELKETSREQTLDEADDGTARKS